MRGSLAIGAALAGFAAGLLVGRLTRLRRRAKPSPAERRRTEAPTPVEPQREGKPRSGACPSPPTKGAHDVSAELVELHRGYLEGQRARGNKCSIPVEAFAAQLASVADEIERGSGRRPRSWELRDRPDGLTILPVF